MAGKKKDLSVHALFCKRDRYRPVDWRYQRVDYLLRKRMKPVAGVDDEYVIGAFEFIDAWKKFNKAKENAADKAIAEKKKVKTKEEVEAARREKLYRSNPGLYHAYLDNRSEEHPEPKLALEAWILTRESDEVIADRLGLFPEQVEWYEAIFFNVRDRLHVPYYITDILNLNVYQGLDSFDKDATAKFFAYWAGPVVLEALLHFYDQALARPGSGVVLDEYFVDYLRNRVNTRAAETVNTYDINQWNIDKLHDTVIRFKEMSFRAEEEFGKVDHLAQIAQVMQENLEWCVGRPREDLLQATGVAAYLGHAVEAPVKHLLMAASGQPPYPPEYLANKQMPGKASDDKEIEPSD